MVILGNRLAERLFILFGHADVESQSRWLKVKNRSFAFAQEIKKGIFSLPVGHTCILSKGVPPFDPVAVLPSGENPLEKKKGRSHRVWGYKKLTRGVMVMRISVSAFLWMCFIFFSLWVAHKYGSLWTWMA